MVDMTECCPTRSACTRRSSRRCLRNARITVSPEVITERPAGVADADFFPAVLGTGLDGATLEWLTREKWARMMGRSRGAMRPMEGAVELVRGLPPRASSRGRLRLTLGIPPLCAARARVGGSFAGRADQDEVHSGKPGSRGLPSDRQTPDSGAFPCTVIEDAVAGMQPPPRRDELHSPGSRPESNGYGSRTVDHAARLLDRPELLRMRASARRERHMLRIRSAVIRGLPCVMSHQSGGRREASRRHAV